MNTNAYIRDGMSTMELFHKQSPNKGTEKELAQTQELKDDILGATNPTLAGTNMACSGGFPQIETKRFGRNS